MSGISPAWQLWIALVTGKGFMFFLVCILRFFDVVCILQQQWWNWILLLQRWFGELLQNWCSSEWVQEASRGGPPGSHSLRLHPWHLSFSFFWSWCWLWRNLTKKLPSLHRSHSSFLSVIQDEPSNSSILQFNLFISWRQSKYHQPLFAKVAERSVLSRSLSYYKNTKHVALLAFLEEPSPENPGMNHGELGWQVNRVTQDTL